MAWQTFTTCLSETLYTKTHQGNLCEIEIKIVYIKKHVYKERKEITHVEIGEETYIIIIYMKKIKYNVCHKWSQDLCIRDCN